MSGVAAACRWPTGGIARLRPGVELGQRALALAQAAGCRGVELWIALMTLAWTESALGNFAAAKQELDELLTMARAAPSHFQVRNGLPSTRVMALCWVTLCCVDTGDFEEARGAREAVRVAEEIDRRGAGSAPTIRPGLDPSPGRQARRGHPRCSRRASSCAPTTYPRLGDDDLVDPGPCLCAERRAGARRGAARAGGARVDRHALHTRLSLRIANLAEAEWLAGNAGRASELTQQALHLAETYGERPAEGQVRRCWATIARRGDAGEAAAAQHYEQALAIARQYGNAPARKPSATPASPATRHPLPPSVMSRERGTPVPSRS
jgi:hypothetical protein